MIATFFFFDKEKELEPCKWWRKKQIDKFFKNLDLKKNTKKILAKKKSETKK